MIKYITFISLVLLIVSYSIKILGQDVSVTINTKRSLHIVDERFISIVIDPFVLISGLNISLQTLNLASHLTPAFIRIYGPSTKRIHFSERELNTDEEEHLIDSDDLIVTPSMWTSLNEWLVNANLTPVFALSDQDRVKDAWNPIKTAMPLMEILDRMNVTCYWELVNEMPDKSLKQYVDDVTSLCHILDAFPASRNLWGVVGGDFSPFTTAPEHMDVTRKLLTTSETAVQAVNFIQKTINGKITKTFSSELKHKPSLWTTAARSSNTTSFKDGLMWAKQLGQAAKMGYDVLFRQPRIKELFELTPAYWISMLHKNLMGCNVLDVRNTFDTTDKCHVYAHCAKRQNRFTKRGAGTVLVVNMENKEMNISIRLLGVPLRNMEIQSYILTTTDENSSDIYLNDQLLTISDFLDGRLEFMPRLRRVRPTKSLILNVPSRSVGFFVIPGAQLSTCIHDENEVNLIREEIYEDQNENWNRTTDLMDNETELQGTNHEVDEEEEELESNEKYYKNPERLKKSNKWKKMMLEKEIRIETGKKSSNKSIEDEQLSNQIRKLIIDEAKHAETEKMKKLKKSDLKQLLQEKIKKNELLVLSNGELKKLKASEIKSEDEKPRRKRAPTTSVENLSNYPIKRQIGIKTRKIIHEDDDSVTDMEMSNDINKESDKEPCRCYQRTGKCTCGSRQISKSKSVENKFISSNFGQSKSNEDIQDIKSLLQKYHHEMQNVIRVISKESSQASNENLERAKRSVNVGPKNLQQEINDIRNRLKLRRELLRNTLKDKLHRKRAKRNTLRENLKTNLVKEEEEDSNGDEKMKRLNRELEQQQKLEDKLTNYLLKIKDSNRKLANKLKRNARSIDIDNNNLHDLEFGSKLRRQYGFHNLKNKQTESELDRAKESDTFLNEISQEDQFLNEIPKQRKVQFYLNEVDDYKYRLGTQSSSSKTVINFTPSPTVSTTASTSHSTRVVEPDYKSSTTSASSQMCDNDEVAESETECRRDGIVDNIFQTTFNFLNDFRNNILHYLRYLTR